MKIWDSYLSPTPTNVKKWLLAVKGIIGTIAGSAFISGKETLAFWLMLAGAVINELGNLISE